MDCAKLLCTAACSADRDRSLLRSRKAAIICMFTYSLLLAELVRHVVHSSEMSEGVVEMQLFHSSGDLEDDRRTGDEQTQPGNRT